MTQPLAGLLVADFSRVLAGPLATMTLADLGATVVKVERPGTGDDTRAWGPPWESRNSSYFGCVNRTKYSVALDLTEPTDRARAAELAHRADILVENHRPGSMIRFGLDYESVHAENPAIVYCSISGFGSGAGAGLPGYDFIVQAVGGLMSITGEVDGDPLKVGVALVDVLTGKDAVIGILAALAARERTGCGDHLEVNLLSSLLGGLVNQAAGYLATGSSPSRMGNAHPSIAPYETLRCSDGLVAVACGNDAQFARLAGVVGRTELAADPKFATNPARVANHDQLVILLEQALATGTAGQWEARFVEAGIPAGLVGDIGSAIARAEALGLAPLVPVGAGRQVRHPISYALAEVSSPAAPPTLDEHGDMIRSWLAGPRSPLPPPPALSSEDRTG